MLSIAKTEWLKIKKYPAFWWVMGITALTYPGVNAMFLYIYRDITGKKSAPGQIAKAILGNPFSFPEAWRTVAYFSSLFVFIPAIVVIMLVTNEFSFKTNRQNIIDGWSRKDFMTGKLLDVLILTLIVTLLYSIVTLLMGNLNGGSEQWKLSYYIALFLLQTFSQLSLAFLIGLVVRKSFLAIAIFAFYFIIVEPIAVNILHYKFKSDMGEFFPLEISHRIIPKPAFIGKFDEAAYKIALDAVSSHVVYTLLITCLFWLLGFWLYNKRDL